MKNPIHDMTPTTSGRFDMEWLSIILPLVDGLIVEYSYQLFLWWQFIGLKVLSDPAS